MNRFNRRVALRIAAVSVVLACVASPLAWLVAREVLDSHLAMKEALGRAIAKRDSDTGGHNYRVAWIAARIGEGMKPGGDEMQALIAGSFLHDVGKIGIPDAILLKPGRLDDGEMAVMRSHVALGEEIVAGIGWLEGAGEVVAGHHEK